MLRGSGFRVGVNHIHEVCGVVRLHITDTFDDFFDLLSILRSVRTHTYKRGL